MNEDEKRRGDKTGRGEEVKYQCTLTANIKRLKKDEKEEQDLGG